MCNVLALHQDLACSTYQHGGYEHFRISDPKQRDIHKASVRDRLVHHALYRHLPPLFDRTFIYDSYSCRVGKGTHKAMDQFRRYARIVSKNHTKTCWVLKCDIRKFFASIDHTILKNILAEKIGDKRTRGLLASVIDSFHTNGREGAGLPLGNLTSQILVNIYMNVFDQFVKRTLKVKYYIRYADDFVFLSPDRAWLESLLPRIDDFLRLRLKLELHPNKVSISTLASGVDFLGWVHFLTHRVLRTSTKRRMLKALRENPKPAIITSYRGMLRHGNTQKLREKMTA